MQGKAKFTRSEIEQLRNILREKQTADRDRQKTLRAKMRRIGFFISDFSDDQGGFTAADLDTLIARGSIKVEPEPPLA